MPIPIVSVSVACQKRRLLDFIVRLCASFGFLNALTKLSSIDKLGFVSAQFSMENFSGLEALEKVRSVISLGRPEFELYRACFSNL